ncbi:HXXEE domain-containing protein [bacterium]|nr:HXXEE domain-containing protein [bacterium]
MNLYYLLPASAILHITEEFLFPGGFLTWYRHYWPEIAASITPRFLFIINAILIIVCFIPPLIGDPAYGIALWLAIAAILFTNAIFHIQASIRTKIYSPGTVTSVLVYLPLTVFGYWTFITNGQASVGTAVSSFLIGASYHWFSLLSHRRRAKTIEK